MTIASELEKLEQMHQRGALSDAEFVQAKSRLLDGAASPHFVGASALNGFRRSNSDRWFGGVCGGLARFTGLDAWLWRLVFALTLLMAGTGLFVYALMWVLVPVESEAPLRSLPTSP